MQKSRRGHGLMPSCTVGTTQTTTSVNSDKLQPLAHSAVIPAMARHQQPAPSQPPPSQPPPSQPAPNQPAPNQPAPHQRAPNQPAPQQQAVQQQPLPPVQLAAVPAAVAAADDPQLPRLKVAAVAAAGTQQVVVAHQQTTDAVAAEAAKQQQVHQQWRNPQACTQQSGQAAAAMSQQQQSTTMPQQQQCVTTSQQRVAKEWRHEQQQMLLQIKQHIVSVQLAEQQQLQQRQIQQQMAEVQPFDQQPLATQTDQVAPEVQLLNAQQFTIRKQAHSQAQSLQQQMLQNNNDQANNMHCNNLVETSGAILPAVITPFIDGMGECNETKSTSQMFFNKLEECWRLLQLWHKLQDESGHHFPDTRNADAKIEQLVARVQLLEESVETIGADVQKLMKNPVEQNYELVNVGAPVEETTKQDLREQQCPGSANTSTSAMTMLALANQNHTVNNLTQQLQDLNMKAAANLAGPAAISRRVTQEFDKQGGVTPRDSNQVNRGNHFRNQQNFQQNRQRFGGQGSYQNNQNPYHQQRQNWQPLSKKQFASRAQLNYGPTRHTFNTNRVFNTGCAFDGTVVCTNCGRLGHHQANCFRPPRRDNTNFQRPDPPRNLDCGGAPQGQSPYQWGVTDGSRGWGCAAPNTRTIQGRYNGHAQTRTNQHGEQTHSPHSDPYAFLNCDNENEEELESDVKNSRVHVRMVQSGAKIKIFPSYGKNIINCIETGSNEGESKEKVDTTSECTSLVVSVSMGTPQPIDDTGTMEGEDIEGELKIMDEVFNKILRPDQHAPCRGEPVWDDSELDASQYPIKEVPDHFSREPTQLNKPENDKNDKDMKNLENHLQTGHGKVQVHGMDLGTTAQPPMYNFCDVDHPDRTDLAHRSVELSQQKSREEKLRHSREKERNIPVKQPPSRATEPDFQPFEVPRCPDPAEIRPAWCSPVYQNKSLLLSQMSSWPTNSEKQHLSKGVDQDKQQTVDAASEQKRKVRESLKIKGRSELKPYFDGSKSTEKSKPTGPNLNSPALRALLQRSKSTRESQTVGKPKGNLVTEANKNSKLFLGEIEKNKKKEVLNTGVLGAQRSNHITFNKADQSSGILTMGTERLSASPTSDPKIPALEERISPSLRDHGHQTIERNIARNVGAITPYTPIIMLVIMLVLQLLTPQVQGEPFFLCGMSRSGCPFLLPRNRDCLLPELKTTNQLTVHLAELTSRSKPVKSMAVRCVEREHTVCTHSGFLGPQGVVADNTAKPPVTPEVCLKAKTQLSFENKPLIQLQPGVYATIQQFKQTNFQNISLQLCCMIDWQLNFIWQLLCLDPSLEARTLLRWNKIVATFAGKALMAWECRPVEVDNTFLDCKVTTTCYIYLPVEIGEYIWFVVPGSRDMIQMAPKVDCNHHIVGVYKSRRGWQTSNGPVHVTSVPLEVTWHSTWDIYIFNTPALVLNKMSALLTTIGLQRSYSYRVAQLEQQMHKLLNYIAELSLDPNLVFEIISECGEVIDHVLRGTGDTIKAIVMGAGSTLVTIVDKLLSRSFQLVLNIVLVGVMLVLIMFALWRILQRIRVGKPLAGCPCRRSRSKSPRDRCSSSAIIYQPTGVHHQGVKVKLLKQAPISINSLKSEIEVDSPKSKQIKIDKEKESRLNKIKEGYWDYEIPMGSSTMSQVPEDPLKGILQICQKIPNEIKEFLTPEEITNYYQDCLELYQCKIAALKNEKWNIIECHVPAEVGVKIPSTYKKSKVVPDHLMNCRVKKEKSVSNTPNCCGKLLEEIRGALTPGAMVVYEWVYLELIQVEVAACGTENGTLADHHCPYEISGKSSGMWRNEDVPEPIMDYRVWRGEWRELFSCNKTLRVHKKCLNKIQESIPSKAVNALQKDYVESHCATTQTQKARGGRYEELNIPNKLVNKVLHARCNYKQVRGSSDGAGSKQAYPAWEHIILNERTSVWEEGKFTMDLLYQLMVPQSSAGQQHGQQSVAQQSVHHAAQGTGDKNV